MDLYDLRQNKQINRFAQDTRDTARSVEESKESILELKQSVQKLALTCQAMWQLIQDNTDLTDTDLIETVEYLEHQAKTALKCPGCGRAQASKRASNCLYCGSALLEEASLDTLFKV